MTDEQQIQQTEEQDSAIRAFNYTTRYFARLIADRFAIRSSLVNQGGSIILRGYSRAGDDFAYPSMIGNDFHLDLIEAEEILRQMPTADRAALIGWADNLNKDQAAYVSTATPAALRQRRSRAVRKAVKRLNDGTTAVEAKARG